MMEPPIPNIFLFIRLYKCSIGLESAQSFCLYISVRCGSVAGVAGVSDVLACAA